MVKPTIHLVSFSGGKDSTAMLLHMMELGMQIDKVLYCDTWMEFPAMYKHIEKIKKIVEDTKRIEFITLKNQKSFKYFLLDHPVQRRKPIEGSPKGYSWADSRTRWCTSKLKIELINKYILNLSKSYNIIQYVGIAADEQYRLQRKSNKHTYPLVEWGWTEEDALKYCYDKGCDWDGLYKIFKRVSCWCCPLQSLEELRKLKKNFPELWQELKEIDEQTWRKFRPNYSVQELEKRFDLEERRLSQGLSINGHSKDFRNELSKIIRKVGE